MNKVYTYYTTVITAEDLEAGLLSWDWFGSCCIIDRSCTAFACIGSRSIGSWKHCTIIRMHFFVYTYTHRPGKWQLVL